MHGTPKQNKGAIIDMSADTEFFFRPAEGEYIETVVYIEPEKASAICGTVKYEEDKGPVKGELILLFQVGSEKVFIDRQFTDEEGQFLFGPIESNELYLIKIYKNSVKIRELEIIAE